MLLRILRLLLLVWAVAEVMWLAAAAVTLTRRPFDDSFRLQIRGVFENPSDLMVTVMFVLDWFHGALPAAIAAMLGLVIWRSSRGLGPPRLRTGIPVTLIAAAIIGFAGNAIGMILVFQLIEQEVATQVYPTLQLIGGGLGVALAAGAAWLPHDQHETAAGAQSTQEAHPGVRGVAITRFAVTSFIAAAAGCVIMGVENTFWLGLIGFIQFRDGSFGMGPSSLTWPLPIPEAVVTAVGLLGLAAFVATCITLAILLFRLRAVINIIAWRLMSFPETRGLALALLLKAPGTLAAWIHETQKLRGLVDRTPLIAFAWVDRVCWMLILIFGGIMLVRLAWVRWDHNQPLLTGASA